MCKTQLPSNTHRGWGFNPRYRQIHSDSDDQSKRWPSVIGSYPQWQVNDHPQRLCLSVRLVSVTRACTIPVLVGMDQIAL